jgi:hypothetical protein
LAQPNLSDNAGVHTCEASLLTDDPQVAALVQGFIDSIQGESQRLDDEVLQTLAKILVVRPLEPRRVSQKRVDVGTSRLWMVASYNLSERIQQVEASAEESGMAEAHQKVGPKVGYEMHSLRWTGQSRFRAEAKPGDLILEVYTDEDDGVEEVTVYLPVPICHRVDDARWTRLYYEVPAERTGYEWNDVRADFDSLGVKGISISTRELTGKAAAIIHLLEE